MDHPDTQHSYHQQKAHTKQGTMTIRPFVNNLRFFFRNAILLFVYGRYFSKTVNLLCC